MVFVAYCRTKWQLTHSSSLIHKQRSPSIFTLFGQLKQPLIMHNIFVSFRFDHIACSFHQTMNSSHHIWNNQLEWLDSNGFEVGLRKITHQIMKSPINLDKCEFTWVNVFQASWHQSNGTIAFLRNSFTAEIWFLNQVNIDCSNTRRTYSNDGEKNRWRNVWMPLEWASSFFLLLNIWI